MVATCGPAVQVPVTVLVPVSVTLVLNGVRTPAAQAAKAATATSHANKCRCFVFMLSAFLSVKSVGTYGEAAHRQPCRGQVS